MLRATRILHQAVKMAVNPPRNPLVAIVGTTGTGKSQLAVDLALRFNGEVINGDAVQMYGGLPIITNKISAEEQKGVPHHLLGCIGLEEPTWRVDWFVRRALDAICDIRSRGRTPILVGGTHYYTQSLLFRGGLLHTNDSDQEGQADESGSDAEDSARWPILNSSSEEMYAKLKEVDPAMAIRWHPNDQRHIRRSLEIWLKTGRRASEMYAEQHERSAFSGQVATSTGQPEEPSVVPEQSTVATSGLRFPTLILWAHTPMDKLTGRLDDRVDAMYRNGLLREAQELDDFARREESKGGLVDKTRGVYIAIGYKQFGPLLDYIRENPGDQDPVVHEKLAKTSIEQTQAATRRYAKRQLRWLRIKLMNALREINADDAVYVLDTSDPEEWETRVLEKATQYVHGFLAGAPMPNTYAVSASVDETLMPLKDYDLSKRRDLWVQRICESCGVTAVTESDWLSHINGTRHKRVVKRHQLRQDRLAALHEQTSGGRASGQMFHLQSDW